MAVALGVLVIEVCGSPKPELVSSAILALLGATAFVLLRDRTQRINLDELRQLASDAVSDRPFEVVWQINEWDIKERSKATITVTQQIRFTRNEVSTIAHWSRGDGKIDGYNARWKRSGGEWIKAHKIHDFPIRTGQKVIYSFDDEHSRGDMLDWCLERDASDRFPAEHEGVEIKARTNTDANHPRVMRVIWPTDAPPSHIELREAGKAARTLSAKRKNGRLFVEEKITDLAVGEAVEIAWTW
jgi:hypothetical protein